MILWLYGTSFPKQGTSPASQSSVHQGARIQLELHPVLGRVQNAQAGVAKFRCSHQRNFCQANLNFSNTAHKPPAQNVTSSDPELTTPQQRPSSPPPPQQNPLHSTPSPTSLLRPHIPRPSPHPRCPSPHTRSLGAPTAVWLIQLL
jgi:hypothetical protein